MTCLDWSESLIAGGNMDELDIPLNRLTMDTLLLEIGAVVIIKRFLCSGSPVLGVRIYGWTIFDA